MCVILCMGVGACVSGFAYLAHYQFWVLWDITATICLGEVCAVKTTGVASYEVCAMAGFNTEPLKLFSSAEDLITLLDMTRAWLSRLPFSICFIVILLCTYCLGSTCFSFRLVLSFCICFSPVFGLLPKGPRLWAVVCSAGHCKVSREATLTTEIPRNDDLHSPKQPCPWPSQDTAICWRYKTQVSVESKCVCWTLPNTHKEFWWHWSESET